MESFLSGSTHKESILSGDSHVQGHVLLTQSCSFEQERLVSIHMLSG